MSSSMSDMADVEGGSLRRVLETFGVEWSGLILLSTLALGFLGLDQYVSLTYWLLGSILALVIVYALQDSISPRFLPTFVVASSVAGLLIGGAFAAFAAFDHLAPAQLLHSADWSRWMTLYLSLTVFGSLGW